MIVLTLPSLSKTNSAACPSVRTVEFYATISDVHRACAWKATNFCQCGRHTGFVPNELIWNQLINKGPIASLLPPPPTLGPYKLRRTNDGEPFRDACSMATRSSRESVTG